ncbi:hypothetical protein WH47_05385, partial [Habropoda laboriosa]
IFSDSKSVVTALQNLETRNTIIRNIIELNAILNCGEKEILYSWIPSHANIEGNEKVDSAAKLVSTSTSESNDVPILYQDLQNYLTKATIELWNEEWKNSRLTKLHTIRNSINDANPAWLLNRKDQVKLTRIKIGHTNWSHSHLITKKEPNNCDICGIQNSIDHILITCPKYNMIRIQHNLPNSLTMLQKEDSSKRAINFLKDIGLYHLL